MPHAAAGRPWRSSTSSPVSSGTRASSAKSPSARPADFGVRAPWVVPRRFIPARSRGSTRRARCQCESRPRAPRETMGSSEKTPTPLRWMFTSQAGMFASRRLTFASHAGMFTRLRLTLASHAGMFTRLRLTLASHAGMFASPRLTLASHAGMFASPRLTLASHTGMFASRGLTSTSHAGTFASPRRMFTSHAGLFASLRWMFASREARTDSSRRTAFPQRCPDRSPARSPPALAGIPFRSHRPL